MSLGQLQHGRRCFGGVNKAYATQSFVAGPRYLPRGRADTF